MPASKGITSNIKMLVGENHNQQNGFRQICWEELVTAIKNPPTQQGNRKQAKAASSVIAAHDAKSKTKNAALKHDSFTLLRLDLDDTAINAEEIASNLQNKGIDSYLIHTTASHKYKGNGNRYRVYIELGERLTYEEWAICETYLSSLFNDADDCASRPGQIMYLPFAFKGYHYLHNEGKAITKQHQFFLESQFYFNELTKQQEESYQQAKEKGFKKPMIEKLVGTQISIIDLIEQSYEWSTLLSSFGYKCKGRAYLAPESNSKVAGAYLLESPDGKIRLYSHHANDPCATGKAIDKLDFISIRQFGGNRKQAIKIIAQSYFPEVHKHNQKEWRISRLNRSVKND